MLALFAVGPFAAHALTPASAAPGVPTTLASDDDDGYRPRYDDRRRDRRTDRRRDRRYDRRTDRRYESRRAERRGYRPSRYHVWVPGYTAYDRRGREVWVRGHWARRSDRSRY